MGKYFNADENFGAHFSRTLRIIDMGEGNGYQIAKGGMVNPKGKLMQYDVIAHTDTRASAEKLIAILCAIELAD